MFVGCRTSSTHKLGLHDIVEESFEKLKNSDSHGESLDTDSKFLTDITRASSYHRRIVCVSVCLSVCHPPLALSVQHGRGP